MSEQAAGHNVLSFPKDNWPRLKAAGMITGRPKSRSASRDGAQLSGLPTGTSNPSWLLAAIKSARKQRERVAAEREAKRRNDATFDPDKQEAKVD